MTLTEFLLARIAEDEETALACIADVGPERAGEPYTDGSGITERDAFPSYPWGSDAAELAFMAGPGHPSRVLAECESKRRIVEAHSDDRGGCYTCGELGSVGPCDTTRLLAAVYADHRDYLQEWKP